MDERLQFVARRLAGEEMRISAGSLGSRADRLQDLRSLQEWGARVDGPKPTTLPLCESTSFQVENFILNVKREHASWVPQDSRAPPAQILRNSHPGQEHHPCGARSPWPGRAPRPRASSAQGTALSVGQRPMNCGAPIQGRVLARQSSILLSADGHRPCQPFLFTCEALSSTREDYAFTVFERLFKERACRPASAATTACPSLPRTLYST